MLRVDILFLPHVLSVASWRQQFESNLVFHVCDWVIKFKDSCKSRVYFPDQIILNVINICVLFVTTFNVITFQSVTDHRFWC